MVDAIQIAFLKRARIEGTAFPRSDEYLQVGDLLYRGFILPIGTTEYYLSAKGRLAADLFLNQPQEVTP